MTNSKLCVKCGYLARYCDCPYTMVPPIQFDEARRKSHGTEFTQPKQILPEIMRGILGGGK